MATFLLLCQVAAIVTVLWSVPHLAAALRDWFTAPVRRHSLLTMYGPFNERERT